MQKNILIVDDSALMRSIVRDIIDRDGKYHVADIARNGVEALDLLTRKSYDVVVLDVNMPRMNGLQLLEEIRKYKIPVRVLMASTDTTEGAKITLDALELGALDFIHKPDTISECRSELFHQKLLQILDVVANSRVPMFESKERTLKERAITTKMVDIIKKNSVHVSGRKIVAIASSTGGPKALQTVIPKLPEDLNAPVLVVQHMPKGFTATLAERLNATSSITVREAKEGDELKRGVVYLAMGGSHMNVVTSPTGKISIHYSDEPYREGVKPCANYTFESLADSKYDEVVCVVLTGMGQDGTVGIKNLMKKKQVHVIAQNEETCVVYGMPKSIADRGMTDQVVPLEQIAQEIILNVGVI
jgi:two-component system chemotaxis response regulator CheB